MRTLTAIYDLEVSPITFDFVKFLLLAEHYRKQYNYTDIKVVILGPSPARLSALLARYSKYSSENISSDFFACRIENVLVPLVSLSNKDYQWSYVADRQKYSASLPTADLFPPNYDINSPVAHYSIECLIDLINHGSVPPTLVTGQQSQSEVSDYLKQLGYSRKNTLAIFLRQTDYETQRNSHLVSWYAFAKKRFTEGYHVVWFTDVESSSEFPQDGMSGTLCCNSDILFRAAFIELCGASFFVNGGMATLARYNHRVISATFKLLEADSPATSKQFWSNKGIAIGQQLPFLSPLQHNEWRQDTAGVIEEVWLEHVKPKLNLSAKQRQEHVDEWKCQMRSVAQMRKVTVISQIPQGARVYVWGSGALARRAKQDLELDDIKVHALVDSFQYGESKMGLACLHPNQLFIGSGSIPVLVVATGDTQSSQQFERIVEYCQRLGRISCRLIDYTKLCNLNLG